MAISVQIVRDESLSFALPRCHPSFKPR